MDILERYPGSIVLHARHAEDVYLVARGFMPIEGIEEISTSWQRCANTYGVDPLCNETPHILTAGEVEDHRGPLEKLVFNAQVEIDRLYAVVRRSGYAILLCDTTGTAIEHRGEDAESNRFKYWGTWLGGVWSEAIEGTNGIGTCITEERPVTIHRSQHFRTRHKNLSCSGAPIFGVDGRLTAVLDVSAIDPELSDQAHALTGALTVTAARAIEERVFREHFDRDWIVALAPPDEDTPDMLLAVDSSQRIVGANRAARGYFILDDQRLRVGVGLWSIFERDVALLRRGDGADIATRLVVAGSGETWPALVTPPDTAFSGRRTATRVALHARPRLDILRNVRESAPAPQARGGLPPGVMRRISGYVETHLSENMDLAVLAGVAGFSVFHFAREFKQTAGVTPHFYLLQKRVQRAKEMLTRTDLSLSEIALAAGFSDQSHLARHFRQMVGSSPREFRWSHR